MNRNTAFNRQDKRRHPVTAPLVHRSWSGRQSAQGRITPEEFWARLEL